MSTRILLSMLMVGLLSAVTLIGGDSARDRQMQRAIELLDTKGDAAAAARLFDDVARNATDALAARALLYLAETQKRQGLEQAQIATYKRILRDYSMHRDVATAARERLAAIQGPIASEPEGMHKQDGTEDDADAWAHITPDGRLLSRADLRTTGDVIIRNMLTGERTRLMAKRDTLETSTDHAEMPMISPDGKRVAYVWVFRNGSTNHIQLRVMPNQRGATSKPLIENDRSTYAYFEPIGWLDGNAVLVTAWRSNNTSEFLWVPLNDRPFKVLKTLGARLGPSRPRLSPDGKYVAYSATPNEPSSEDERLRWRTQGPLHLHVLATDFSDRQSDIVRGHINESPIWSPDGKRILFISNRADGFGLWTVDVSEGDRLGSESYLDDANIASRIRPVGMTSSGTLFYVPEQRGGVDVYHIRLDPGTGRVIGNRGTRLLDSLVNRSQAPSWSPDGQRIVFKRQPVADPDLPRQAQLEVVIYSLATQMVDKAYSTTNIDAGQVIWQPDDRYLLVRRRRDGGLFRMTAETGALREIESVVNTRLPPECGSHVLSRDGRTLYLSVLDPLGSGLSLEARASAKRTRRLVALDMDDGDQHELMKTQKLLAMSVLAASPDGTTLALAMMEEGWKRPRLMLATVADQKITKIRELTTAILPRAGSWTKAGLLIAADTGERFEIVRVSVADGTLTPTGLSLARGQFFDVSPDGTHIVYSERSGKRGPLWTYNRLLPAAPATASRMEPPMTARR